MSKSNPTGYTAAFNAGAASGTKGTNTEQGAFKSEIQTQNVTRNRKVYKSQKVVEYNTVAPRIPSK